MKPTEFMFIAGEPSGDLLGAELVRRLREEGVRRGQLTAPRARAARYLVPPRFFGAGGDQMAAAGVEIVVDLTAHAVVGLVEVLQHYGQFKRLFRQLLDLALARQPDVIVCIDFSGFNRRFARAVRARLRRQGGPFNNWRPKIIQYVSPQVWASRPGRAQTMARDLDLLLSIFPFEQDWFARHAPRLRVEFVGHPIMERYAETGHGGRPHPGLEQFSPHAAAAASSASATAADRQYPLVLLLPGSRVAELKRHLPVMLKAVGYIGADWPCVRFRMVLPNEFLLHRALEMAAAFTRKPPGTAGPLANGTLSVSLGRLGVRQIEICNGGLVTALREATIAIASTGTVTLECAYFGMPTVAIYKTSPSTYQVARRIVLVQHLAMPNLLAGEAVFPELIQKQATPQNVAHEALELLEDADRRQQIQRKLASIIAGLGGPGAGQRAARAIWDLFDRPAVKAG